METFCQVLGSKKNKLVIFFRTLRFR